MMLMSWCGKVQTQSEWGVEQYYYMGARKAFTVVPVAYYQAGNKWYVEGRYNYEALKTFSVYVGKTYENKSAFSYSVSPVAGIVAGEFNGGSVGANISLEYKRFSFSSQCQYTFSLKKRAENFVYSWSDLGYQALENACAGISVQETGIYHTKHTMEKGFFVKVTVKKWSFPVYIFSPVNRDRYCVLGLNYEL